MAAAQEPPEPTLPTILPSQIVFSIDGKELFTSCPRAWVGKASKCSGIFAWDVATGALSKRQFTGHDAGCNCVTMSLDGKLMATGGGDNDITGRATDPTIRIWDVDSGKELQRITVRGRVTSIQFSADGKKILGASTGDIPAVWDVQTGQKIFSIGSKSNIVQAALNADATLILSLSEMDELVVRKASNGEQTWSATPADGLTQVKSPEWSPNANMILLVNGDGTSVAFDSRTGKRLQVYGDHAGADAAVLEAHFSADSKQVITASTDHSIEVWDALSGKSITKINAQGKISEIKMSPDGSRILAAWATPQGGLAPAPFVAGTSMWDTRSGKEIRRLTKNDSGLPMGPLAFTPDGKAALVKVSTVQLWDLETGKTIHEYK